MILVVGKYLTLISLLATVSWFFWNPAGWKFEWEPIVVFFAALSAFVGLDWKDHHSIEPKYEVHAADVQLFRKLAALLPSTGIIRFLREHDFLGAFYLDELKPLSQFRFEWKNSEHEFIDEELEKGREELLEAVTKFSELIAKYSSPNSVGLQAVRSDRHIDDPAWQDRY